MIVILGIFSLFQLTLLPGLIVSRLLKLREAGIIILASITISPIVNYLFVFTATAIGAYTRPVTLTFFGIETATLIYLTYPLFNKTLGQIFNAQKTTLFFKEYLDTNNKSIHWSTSSSKAFRVAMFLLAIVAIGYSIASYLSLNISVFTAWDAVVSWDRWAVDWYNNTFPAEARHYPQLVPANWSLNYQFIGDSRVKFFAKTFMGLIEVYIPVTIFIVGIKKRETGYFFGAIIATWLQSLLGSQGNGYVDTSVAFFALSSMLWILLSQTKKDRHRNTYLLVGAFIAAGTAVTKQTGLWIALIYPLLVFLVYNNKTNHKRIYQLLPKIIIIYALVIAPWYGYKEYQIQAGNDRSEITDNASIGRQDRDWLEQLNHSFNVLQSEINDQPVVAKQTMAVIILSMLFACANKFYRYIFILIIIPITLVWALYFSYDTRNLTLVIPLVGLVAGIGMQKIIDVIIKAFKLDSTRPALSPNNYTSDNAFNLANERLLSIRVIYLLIPLLFIFLLPLQYSDEYITKRSVDLQKEIGNRALNRKLYEYQSTHGFDGKILTDYLYLSFLPGLEGYAEISLSAYPTTFLKDIEEERVAYALLSSYWMDAKVAQYVEQNINSRKMSLIFEHGNQGKYFFVSTCRGPCDKK